MSLAKEFKEFAMRGNVIDLAVGVVIGAAFGKIVSALVEAIVMPALGWLIGGVNFSDLVITLGTNVTTGEPVNIGYGRLIQSIVDFVIIAAAIFMAVKAINSLKKPAPAPAAAPAAPPPPPRQEVLLEEIRDLLAKSQK
ncbi:MAG: large-conductance mechanosensitive channel protein MscL [Steroidobacteraceae bacterium]|nr:large-conductance mechanosensitive channel protein MscL [Steroidobacteraceae bacterium]